MSNIVPKAAISFECSIQLSEIEARALEALAGYSEDDFIKLFYEHMGKAYLQPHEKGLRSLFDACRVQLRPQLGQIDTARKALKL